MQTAAHGPDQKIVLFGAAMTALICALSISIPVFGFLFFLIVPLPAFYYRLRLGTKKAALIAGCAFIFLVFFSGGLSADLFFIAGMLLLGFFMGEFIEKDLAIEKTIGYASGLVLAAGAFGLVIYANISNLGLAQMISGYISRNLEMTIALYKSMEMPEESIALLTESMDQIRYVLVRILPAIFTAGLLLSAWINLLLAKVVLKSKKYAYQSLVGLNAWKTPDTLVWGVVASALMLMMPAGFLKLLGINGMIVFTIIYFFQGIAIISFYFEKKSVPSAIRFLLYGTIIIQQILIFAIAGVGFFDVWLNFRKLGNNDTDHQIPLSS